MPPSCDELPCLTSQSTEETAAELFFITEIILDLNSGAVVQPSAGKKKKKKKLHLDSIMLRFVHTV